MATRTLGTLTLDLIAKTGGFVAGMDKAARAADKRSKQIERRIRKTSQVAGKAFKALSVAALAAFATISKGTSDAIQGMADMQDSADALGVTAKQYSSLAFAAKSVGVESGTLDNVLAKLNRRMANASTGSKQQQEMFAALGVSVKDVNGHMRSSIDVLEDIAKAYKRTGASTDFVATANQLLGNKFRDIVPLISGGKDAMEALRKEAEATGNVFDDKTGRAAQDFETTMTKVRSTMKGLFTQVATELLPVLKETAEDFYAWATENDRVASAAKTLVKWVKAVADNIKLITAGFAALFALSILPKLIAITRAVKALVVAVVSLDAALLPVAAVLAAVAGSIALLTAKYVSHARAVKSLKRQQDLTNQAMLAAKKISADSAAANKNLVPYINNITKANKERAKSALSVADAARAANMAEINKLQRGVDLHVDPMGRRTGALARQEQREALQRGIQTASPTVARQMQSTLDAINKAYDPKRDAAMIAKLRGLQKDQQALQDAMLKVSLGIAKVGNTTTAAVSGGAGTISTDAKKRAAELKALQDKMRADDVAGVKKEIAAEGKRLDAVNAVKDALATQQEQAKKTLKQRLSVIRSNKEYFDDPVEAQARAWRAYAKSVADAADSTKQATDKMSEYGKQAARNMQDAFADFLFNPFQDGLKGLLGSFIDTLRRMATEALASRIFDSLGSGSDGKTGWFSSILGAVFGGGKASGGAVSSGRLYEVNERRPELLSVGGRDYLMMGAQSGRVDPNPKSVTRSNSTTINVAVQPTSTRRTASQVATEVARKQRLASSRNG